MNTYFFVLLFLLLHCFSETRAQAPAGTPTPAVAVNVTAILEKAGQFTTLIRLLKGTQIGDQVNVQLQNSNSGLTLFAPTDNAFSSLFPGTLNSLTDEQKVALIQFHVLPTFVSMPQFQTVSNPVRTQAGDASGGGGYPLNVTSVGNQVNITTGVVNTTISNALFSNGKLAVYQVEKVLLPLKIFGPAASAPAPAAASAPAAESKKKKAAPASAADGPSKVAVDASTAAGLRRTATGGIAAAALLCTFWWKL